jgi:putative redox protein
MSLTASARRIGNTLRHEVDVNGRHAIVTDEPAGLGGTDTGPAPHELLAAALASCVSTMIALYANRKQWDIGEISVDVEYDHDSEPRRFDTTVNLPDGLTQDQIERLQRVADTCPVRRALEAGFSFDEHISFPAQDPATPTAPEA